MEMSITDKTKEQIISDYIQLIELVMGKKIKEYGIGPSREGYCSR